MDTPEKQTEFNFITLPTQSLFEFSSEAMPLTFLTLTPSYNVSFHLEGKTVGVLDWNDGVMKFSGSADESARIFFEQVIRRYNDYIPTGGTGWKS